MYGYEYTNHLILNEQMVNLWQEEDGKKVAEVWVLPGYGANLCRFKVDNIDYLYPALVANNLSSINYLFLLHPCLPVL